MRNFESIVAGITNYSCIPSLLQISFIQHFCLLHIGLLSRNKETLICYLHQKRRRFLSSGIDKDKR